MPNLPALQSLMSAGWGAGILQEAMGRGEYWRLIDSQGRPPGLLGMWPSRAVSFIENHDTGERLPLKQVLCWTVRRAVSAVCTYPCSFICLCC